ncbi:MAG: uracil-DNA glycosylase [Candidatus Pacebacteria bacterium]|nr:uracil-DNA glycosylase [Candidatus Paceibacterota bacterium]
MVVPAAWADVLQGYEAPYARAVRDTHIAPSPEQVFRAFSFFPPSDTRVVILGQDPYHTPGVADGLAFSTFSENRIPPSLKNIFKELHTEGFETTSDPDLTRWAEQGVLLLNASLTVRTGEANSHADYGWHQRTDAVIKSVSDTQRHVVFMLWGAFARKKAVLIDTSKHLVLESAHPSPLSAHNGFFGNNHFKRANDYLTSHGRSPIDWV